MKKIVGILAVAAMAASMFAADISAQLQIDGDLLNYDGTDVKALMVKEYDPSGSSDYLWKLSVNGDKAGAEIWSWNYDGSVTEKSIWLKPIDSLKITVGNMTVYSCWNPQFGWWAKNLAFEKYGVKAEYTNGAFGLEAAIGAGAGNYFFNNGAKGYDKVADFVVSGTYALDAGKAQLYVAKGAGIHPHGFTGWDSSALAVGAVWGNNPYMQNGYFVDVAATFAYKPYVDLSWTQGEGFAFEKVNVQAYYQFFTNGFGAQIIAVGGYKAEKYGWDNAISNINKFDATATYGFEAKFSYAIDAYTPYLQINGYDIAAKKLGVDLGVTTSVGACGLDAKVSLPLDFNAGSTFTFSVPVQCNVAF